MTDDTDAQAVVVVDVATDTTMTFPADTPPVRAAEQDVPLDPLQRTRG